MIALCSATVDWSATGTWVTGSATVVVAIIALHSWKTQIKLQDKYSKVDSLLEAFVKCVRAGHDWQWHSGMGETRDIFCENDLSKCWKDALMQYRMDWSKIKFHLNSIKDDLWFEPNKLQSRIIQIGINLQHPNVEIFQRDIQTLLDNGIKDISNLKNK
ncbi:MAG: hypothetical protein V4545_06475 [Pseudomonadota bacterium]